MKIGYVIGGTAAVLLAGYVGYLYLWDPATKSFKFKKSDTKQPDLPAAAVADKVTTVVKQPAVTPKGAGVTITEPVRSGSGFTGTPVTSPPVTPKIGDKAFAGSNGANAYTTANAGASNIYKYYAPGKYIGTYLGTEGAFSKIIVEETGFFTNTNKTVFVLPANIKY